jgi:hypothetical protein
MRKLMIAAGAAALLAASSLAALAAEADGAVASVDAAAGTVTLNDGNTYTLPAGFDAAALQAGTKVHIIYEQDADGKMVASEIQPST